MYYNLSKCLLLFLSYISPLQLVILVASFALMAQCCIIALMISMLVLLTLRFCFSVCLPSFPVCGIYPACWPICACVVSEQIPICDVTHAKSILGKALTAVTDDVQIFQNAGWASESVWTDKDNVALTGIRSRTVQTITSS